MKPIHWVVVGLVLVIVALILFKKDESSNYEKKQYDKVIADWKALAKQATAQTQSILDDANKRMIKDSLAIKRYNVEINILKKKVAISRARVDTIIRDNPELAVFVSQQDSIIIIQGQQIDTLKQAYASQIKTTEDLIQNHDAQESIEARIDLEQTERIADLEKQVRKTKRGSKLAKVLIPIVGLGAFILGGL